jgi:hypothetical protein
MFSFAEPDEAGRHRRIRVIRPIERTELNTPMYSGFPARRTSAATILPQKNDPRQFQG